MSEYGGYDMVPLLPAYHDGSTPIQTRAPSPGVLSRDYRQIEDDHFGRSSPSNPSIPRKPVTGRDSPMSSAALIGESRIVPPSMLSMRYSTGPPRP